MRPKLKPSVHVFRRGETRFLFCDWGKRKVRQIEASPQVADLLLLADGTSTTEDITQKVKSVSRGQVEAFFETLAALDIVLDENVCYPLTALSRKIAESFETYSDSSEQAVKMVDSLQDANVAVVGIGGVGSWVVQMLAMQRIGGLVLIDPDVVEPSNLHRQALYLPSDAGQLKVACAEQAVEQLSPSTRVITHVLKVEADFQLDCIPDVDLVISCADEPTRTRASMIVSEFCFRRQITHIVGAGYTTAVGTLPQTIIPSDPSSACLRCHRTNLSNTLGEFLVRGEAGIPLAPLVATVGQLVAMEAIRVITKFEPPLFINRRGSFDSLNLSFALKSLERQVDCSFCARLRGTGLNE